MADITTLFRNKRSPVSVLLSYDVSGDTQNLVLDNVSDTSLTLSSTITEHPIINGDIVADHMYDNPASMTIEGDFDESVMSFEKIQKIFEDLKTFGIPLRITKQKLGSDSKAMFQTRENMVLQSISWGEKISTMHFSFSFHQILVVDVTEETEFVDDELAPLTTDLKTLNFTDLYLDADLLKAQVLQVLKDEDLIDGKMLESFSSFYWGSVKFFTELVARSNPIGNIILSIRDFIRFIKKKRAKYNFKWSLSKKKNQQRMADLEQFLNEVVNAVKQLNTKIRINALVENRPQSCYFTIGEQFCYFKFMTETTVEGGQKYVIDATVEDGNDTQIVAAVSISSALISITDCNSDTALCKVGNESMWLLRDQTKDENDLTSLIFLTTSVDMRKWTEELATIIRGVIYE